MTDTATFWIAVRLSIDQAAELICAHRIGPAMVDDEDTRMQAVVGALLRAQRCLSRRTTWSEAARTAWLMVHDLSETLRCVGFVG